MEKLGIGTTKESLISHWLQLNRLLNLTSSSFHSIQNNSGPRVTLVTSKSCCNVYIRKKKKRVPQLMHSARKSWNCHALRLTQLLTRTGLCLLSQTPTAAPVEISSWSQYE